VIILQR